MDGIQMAHVLEPSCGFYAPKPQNLFDQRRSLEEKPPKLEIHDLLRSFWCRVRYVFDFFEKTASTLMVTSFLPSSSCPSSLG